MSRTRIIVIVVLVIVLIIVLLYTYRDKLFSSASAKTTLLGVDSSKFPLKNGSFNLPEVGKLQTYLKSKGGKSCNGTDLVVDNDFGPNTECATKQILGVTEVSQQLYNSLGL